MVLNFLSANPRKWSNTLKQFVGHLPTNCLSVFDHFVILVLKGLKDEIRLRSVDFVSNFKHIRSYTWRSTIGFGTVERTVAQPWLPTWYCMREIQEIFGSGLYLLTAKILKFWKEDLCEYFYLEKTTCIIFYRIYSLSNGDEFWGQVNKE